MRGRKWSLVEAIGPVYAATRVFVELHPRGAGLQWAVLIPAIFVPIFRKGEPCERPEASHSC